MMQRNRFTTFSKIFTMLIVLGAMLSIAACKRDIEVEFVTISTVNDISEIAVFRGSLQMLADVEPEDATDPSVVWSVQNGTGSATINATGLLSALSNGTVTVKATSLSNDAISGTKVITISKQEIVVASVAISSAGDETTIETKSGTLQMSALVLPADAADKSVIWSVENGTGAAIISQTGLLTAVDNGTVTVKATATSDPDMFDEMEITLSHQEVVAASVTLSSAGDAEVIATFRGTLQMTAVVLPSDTVDKSVVWTVENGTGEATITQSGLLSALANGTVTVKVAAANDPLVFDTMVITISKQEILIASISVAGHMNATTISTFRGTLQMNATILPADAEDQTIIWSVVNGTGEATISASGLLSALDNGTVTVYATSSNQPLIQGARTITLSNQDTLGTSVAVVSAGGATVIDTFRGTLQFSATVLPADTDNKSVVWSVTNGTGEATISASGLLSALDNGTVTVKAALVTDPLIFNTMVITLSNQDVLATSVEVLSAGNVDVINTFGGTLQFSVIVLPENTDNKSVVWSVTNGTGEATISASGLVTALENGTVTVKATSATDAQVFGVKVITISNQEVLVTGVEVVSAGDVIVIDTFGGTLQFTANILPTDADDKSVVWSVTNGTGEATISASGLLTAVADGTVVVKATSVSSPLVNGTKEITISNQAVLVTSVALSADVVVINTFGGTLQINALVLPENAENKAVIWSVTNGTGSATISATGLLTAVSNGTVVVKAVSDENAEIFGTLEITISNQEVLAESILVSSEGDAIIIDVLDGTLQMYAEVLPVNADDQAYTWSVVNGTGQASINELGVLTAIADGTVLVKAILTSDPLIFGSLEITISNQEVVVVTGGVDLLSAGDFTILSKTGISTTVGTHITGNLGVSPGPESYITGFDLTRDASNTYSTSALVTGMIYAADLTAPTPSYLSTAISDMETAYTDAAGRAPDFTELHAGDLSGQTLVPGVYYWSSGVLINTDVTLSGSATDIWIFQIAGTLTQAAGASIMLSGGAVAENIVWQVAAAVAIGVGSHFEGTILGMTSVDLGTNASYVGKIFAQTAVSLDGNDVN